MEAEVLVIAGLIGLALLAIIVLPMRKRWNEAGQDDEARKQAILRDLEEE